MMKINKTDLKPPSKKNPKIKFKIHNKNNKKMMKINPNKKKVEKDSKNSPTKKEMMKIDLKRNSIKNTLEEKNLTSKNNTLLNI